MYFDKDLSSQIVCHLKRLYASVTSFIMPYVYITDNSSSAYTVSKMI